MAGADAGGVGVERSLQVMAAMDHAVLQGHAVSGGGGFATLSGVHSTAGNIIAGDVLIEKGKEVVSGVVSYINYTDGYFRVNGIPGDSTTGVMVRLNDPTSRHTIQTTSRKWPPSPRRRAAAIDAAGAAAPLP